MRGGATRGAWACLLALAWSMAGPVLADGAADQVVVLANGRTPASLELARYYMAQRGIPTNHLCVLDLPEGEVISRGDYERRLRDPLLAFLRETGLITQRAYPPEKVQPHRTRWETTGASIRYLVSCYGVPLRIADTRFSWGARIADKLGKPEYKNTAAVDSELALLLHPGYDIGGFRPNPLFRLLSPRQLASPPYHLLLATRLDGPDPATVRRMIDDSLAAEKYGLQGRGYFDGRSLTDEYFVGDYWLRESYERFRREGYECVLDVSNAMWSEAYPMEDAAIYMGWYAAHVAGPFTRAGFRFRPGAVAYHIHSGSAITLRSTTRRWAGPLLARGAAATMGAVNEPYLGLTPHLQIFSDRLCRGYPLADSAYMSLSHLSWQVTIVGDPLYRPFRYSLDEQIQHLEKDGRPELEWALVRKVNLLVRNGRFNPALDLCRAKIAELDSLVLREKLADLYGANELYAEAGREYETILARTRSPATAMRVGTRWMLILRLLGKDERAGRIEARLREQWPDSPMLAWLNKAKP